MAEEIELELKWREYLMTKWRPDDWGNPYDLYMAGMTIRPNEKAEDYEAGADAMLEGLKGEARRVEHKGVHLGWLVFIPVTQQDTK